ncbi:hypothetical protein ACFOWU_16060 [Epilithonimonas zeae]|uniref:Uncharacterized protein n=1 Tax=Epilithonimonas zeae TaxID=1416779 RepID=A0A1N6IAU7_9FLAO|nr:hypothetical protein [Epilithonimonas zeae]SIO29111.1 hypothetical protein SAMN05444409_2485 [Epilithonimonas zeae]
MKNLLFLTAIAIASFSCKSTINPDNLPKPLPERPKENPDNANLTQQEAQEMENLKSEILTMAKSEKCTNPVDWKSVGLGVKACGGPVSYIAYSSKIDEAKFLEKVNLYNQKSTEYNKKYNLVSDCMLVMPPEKIECENGNPVFKY